MFIAMNRFRVKKGSEQAFEKVWLSRDSQLNKVPGFVEFHLLKGPEHEDFTLYASHTVWQNKGAFEAWTKSEAFRAVHKDVGQNKPLYIDQSQFKGVELRQNVHRVQTKVYHDCAGPGNRLLRAMDSIHGEMRQRQQSILISWEVGCEAFVPAASCSAGQRAGNN